MIPPNIQDKYLQDNLPSEVQSFLNEMDNDYIFEIDNIIENLKEKMSEIEDENVKAIFTLYLAHYFYINNKFDEANTIIGIYRDQFPLKRDFYYGYLKYSNVRDPTILIINCYSKDEDVYNAVTRIGSLDNKRIHIRRSKEFDNIMKLFEYVDKFNFTFFLGHGGEDGLRINMAKKTHLLPEDFELYKFNTLRILGIFSCEQLFANSDYIKSNFEVLLSDGQSIIPQLSFFLYEFVKNYLKTGNIFSAFNAGEFAILLNGNKTQDITRISILGDNYQM